MPTLPASLAASTSTTASMMTDNSTESAKRAAPVTSKSGSASLLPPLSLRPAIRPDTAAEVIQHPVPLEAITSLSSASSAKHANALLAPNTEVNDGPEAAVKMNDEELKKRRDRLNDALKEWYSDLAQKRAEVANLQAQPHVVSTEKYEEELTQCEEEIEWLREHIQRCKRELEKLPPEKQQPQDRTKGRRNAILKLRNMY